MFESAPARIVVRESGMRSAVSLLNNRQRMYGYCLLAAPRIQPIRDILPVTLREGEDQAQSGELP